MELEHKSLWATKEINGAFEVAGCNRALILNELEEFQIEAYESSRIYKERAKKFHDLHINKE